MALVKCLVICLSLLLLVSETVPAVLGAGASAAADDEACPAKPGGCHHQSDAKAGLCVCRPAIAAAASRSPLVSLPAGCHHASLCPGACPPPDLPPGAFSASPGLTKLVLTNCGLRSVARESLGNLAALTNLLLDANSLGDGSIDAHALSEATPLLQALHASSNYFTRLPDIELPPHLARVSLAANQLGDCSLPKRWRGAEALTSLTLSANPLRRIGLSCLPQGLEALVCRSCPLEVIDSLGKAIGGSLTSLRLSLPAGNWAKAAVASAGGEDEDSSGGDADSAAGSAGDGATRLIGLTAALEATSGLRVLSTLELQRFGQPAELRGDTLAGYAWAGGLTSLDLSRTGGGLRLMADGGRVFAGLTVLRNLRLVQCGLADMPAGLPASLLNLDLSHNSIRWIPGDRLAGLTNLQHLRLIGNRLARPPCLCALSELAGLWLHDGGQTAALEAARLSRGQCPCGALASSHGGGGSGHIAGGGGSGHIAGGVAGGIIGFVAAVGVAVFLVRRRRTSHGSGAVHIPMPEMGPGIRGRYHSNGPNGDVENPYAADSSLNSTEPLNPHQLPNGASRPGYGLLDDVAAAPPASQRPLPARPEEAGAAAAAAASNSDTDDLEESEAVYTEQLLPPACEHLIVCRSADVPRHFAGAAWRELFAFATERSPAEADGWRVLLRSDWRTVLVLVTPQLVECAELRRPLRQLVKAHESPGGKVRALMTPEVADTPEFDDRLRQYCRRLAELRHRSGRLLAWKSDPRQLARELGTSSHGSIDA